VCRRWHEVSTNPGLLREVVLLCTNDDKFLIDRQSSSSDSQDEKQASSEEEEEEEAYEEEDIVEAALEKLQCFLSWLHMHGHSVRRLKIHLLFKIDDVIAMTADEMAELTSAVDSCITVCAASLERLVLELMSFTYTLGAWADTAHRLQRLGISLSDLTAKNSLEHLTSLQRLEVCAWELQLEAAVRLPISLTSLRIRNHDAEAMPSQVWGDGCGALQRQEHVACVAFFVVVCEVHYCLWDLCRTRLGLPPAWALLACR
jgi:hypothetical protein